ncbi:MAG: sialidase family protein [candidate division WOR-3 bacterium]
MGKRKGYRCALIFLILAVNGVVWAQWEPDRRLTSNSGTSLTSRNSQWCIGANGSGMVHIVFYDDRSGNNEIYYLRSTDNGLNWGAEMRLTDDTARSWTPSIAVTDSVVHLVWFDTRDGPNGEIYYLRSTDNGLSWSDEVRMSFDTARSEFPCVAAEGEDVILVWRDNRDSRFSYEIYYRRSGDGGVTWSDESRLTNAAGIKWNPSVAISGNLVHLVWADNRDGNWNVYYKRSTDHGVSWEADLRLTENVFAQEWPCVAARDSVVVVAYSDNEDVDAELFCVRSYDGGENWQEPVRISCGSAQPGIWSPNIAISGERVHAVWYDMRDGNAEIYYAFSTDSGQTWEERRLTEDSSRSNYPSVALGGTLVHVVWTDFRDGPTGEIYYKRNPSGNVGIKEQGDERLRGTGGKPVLFTQREKVEIFDASGQRVKGEPACGGVYFLKGKTGFQKRVFIR